MILHCPSTGVSDQEDDEEEVVLVVVVERLESLLENCKKLMVVPVDEVL